MEEIEIRFSKLSPSDRHIILIRLMNLNQLLLSQSTNIGMETETMDIVNIPNDQDSLMIQVQNRQESAHYLFISGN